MLLWLFYFPIENKNLSKIIFHVLLDFQRLKTEEK